MKKILILIPCLLLMMSCDDVINLTPTDSIDATKAFESLEDIELGIIGLYSPQSTDYIGLASRMSDELRLSPENRGQGVQMHSWQFTAGQGEVGGPWGNRYSIIARANRILEAIDRLEADGTIESGPELEELKGITYAARGWAHFDLVRFYAPKYDAAALAVPYIINDEAGLSITNQPARETTSEVYAKINSDLDLANSLITEFSTENNVITKLAIQAMQARVALYQEDWGRALSKAQEVIGNTQGVALATRTQLPLVFSEMSDAGVIFKLSRLTGDGRVSTFFQDTNGDIFFAAAQEMIDLFQASDVRTFYHGIDPFFSNNEVIVTKYSARTQNEPIPNDPIVLRMAEMYLIAAEAAARTNDFTAANGYLNDLRRNRINGFVDQNIDNLDGFLSEVLLERQKELAYEGHRMWDLKRFGQGVTRLAEDCAISSACDLAAEAFQFTLAIPQAEIFANDNMVQNPGYN